MFCFLFPNISPRRSVPSRPLDDTRQALPFQPRKYRICSTMEGDTCSLFRIDRRLPRHTEVSLPRARTIAARFLTFTITLHRYTNTQWRLRFASSAGSGPRRCAERAARRAVRGERKRRGTIIYKSSWVGSRLGNRRGTRRGEAVGARESFEPVFLGNGTIASLLFVVEQKVAGSARAWPARDRQNGE